MKFEHDFSIQLYMYWSFSLCDENLEWELLTSSVRDWCCFMILYIKTKSIHNLNDTNTFHFHFKLFAFQNSEIEVGKHLLLIKCAEKNESQTKSDFFYSSSCWCHPHIVLLCKHDINGHGHHQNWVPLELCLPFWCIQRIHSTA